MTSGSSGSALRSKSTLTVGTAMAARSTAGSTVSPISMAGLPWTCLGVNSSSGRSRKRTMATPMMAKTMTPTTAAIRNTGQDRLKIFWA